VIEKIWGSQKNGDLLAIWVHGKQVPREQGTCQFLTPPFTELQVGYFNYQEGHEFKAHKHIPRKRVIEYTAETLLICSGSLRFDLYCENGDPVRSDVAVAGDILILLRGGHGFQALADLEMIEIKQGPFNPRFDKMPLHGAEEDASV